MNTLPNSLMVASFTILPILRNSVHLVIADIVRLEADDNYTRFIMADGRCLMTSKNLGCYEELLPNSFVRIRRGCLLNLHYLRSRKGRTLRLTDGTIITLARRKVKLFRPEEVQSA